MARRFRQTRLLDVGNVLMRLAARTPLAPPGLHVLTTEGQRSGQRRTNPVRLVEHDDEQYLVAPYGEMSWVHNARAAGWVELARRGRSQRYEIDELEPSEAAPVLREYLRREAIVRPYFDADPDGPLDAFAAEAERHPVFALRPT